MSLHRLKPVVRKINLGSVCLWRDDLAEMIRMVRQLEGVQLRIEADDYLVDDVETDLPQIGPKVHKLAVTATRMTGEGSSKEVVNISLSADTCQIKATDPDLTIMGLMDAIGRLVSARRRIPISLRARHVSNSDMPRKIATLGR